MRRRIWAVASVAAIFLLAASGHASTRNSDATPIPLRPPTGYRDYCDGATKAQTRLLCPRGGVPPALWRPFVVPSLSSGESCPVSQTRTLTSRIAPVIGTGPVFFVAGAYDATDRTTMVAVSSPNGPAAGTGWNIAKAPLVVKATFRQPLAVRGGRIDGPGELGFSGFAGRRPFAAMQWAGTSPAIPLGNYKAHSLLVWVTKDGCYALQIDGSTFSRVIVFRVALDPAKRR
jgi:hypothetical protein